MGGGWDCSEERSVRSVRVGEMEWRGEGAGGRGEGGSCTRDGIN